MVKAKTILNHHGQKQIEGEDDQKGKIVTVDVPIVDISENKDVVMEDLGDEG